SRVVLLPREAPIAGTDDPGTGCPLRAWAVWINMALNATLVSAAPPGQFSSGAMGAINVPWFASAHGLVPAKKLATGIVLPAEVSESIIEMPSVPSDRRLPPAPRSTRAIRGSVPARGAEKALPRGF